MDVSSVARTGNAGMATAVKQLQTVSDLQVETMKQLVDSQQQVAQMLQAAGIGQNVNVQA